MEAIKNALIESAYQGTAGNNDYNTVSLCSGNGKYHTNNSEAKNSKPLNWINIQQIEDLLINSDQVKTVPKDNAQWVIPCDYQSRDHAELKEKGNYWALWFDGDELNGVTQEQSIDFASTIIDGKLFAWSSRSATEEQQKHRIFVPMSRALTGYEWVAYQRLFNDKMEKLGVKPDRVSERCGQPCFLPNRGDFFKTYVDDFLPPFDPDQWADEVAEMLAEDERIRQEAKKQHEANKLKLKQLVDTQGIPPRTLFSQAHDSFTTWVQYGATPQGKRLLSPYSETGSAAIVVLEDDTWISHHGSDQAHGVGRTSADGHTQFGDSFDLYCHFEHGGNEVAAVKAVAEMLDKDANDQRQQEFAIEKARELAEAEFQQFREETKHNNSQANYDLLIPPGIAGDICRLMHLRARRVRPELYPLAALHLLALVGKNRSSIYTDKLNLITLAIALTAAGKEAAQQVTKELAADCFNSRHICSDIASFKDMIDNLIQGDGSTLYIIDEVHSMIDSIKSKNAQSYESKIEKEILTMTSTSLYVFRGKDKRENIPNLLKSLAQVEKKLNELPDEISEDALKLIKVRDKIKRNIDYLENGWPDPFCSIMGHSVPARLDDFASTGENIDSGFLGRSLVVRCPESRERLNRNHSKNKNEADALHHDIVERLNRIRTGANVLLVDDDADAYIQKCIDYYEDDERRNCHYLGGIYARATEQLTKVASILAVETGVIRLEHARYADALVKASIEDIRYLLVQGMAKSDAASESAVLEHARIKILKECKGSGIAPSRLEQMITRSTAWKEMQNKDMKRNRFEELITLMLGRDEIELIEEGRKKRIRSKAVV